MNGEIWLLVEVETVQVQDCKKITDRFRGIIEYTLNLTKENRKMSTCNRLDLEPQGYQPIGVDMTHF